MNLFKSKAQRQMDREIEIRRGIQTLRRNLRNLDKNIADYRAKAVRAKQISADDQLKVLKEAIRRSLAQVRLQERQLLAIETATQMKTQAESMEQFASSMQAVSQSIAASFGGTDLTHTLANYERAMSQAKDMEERMNLFLDMSSDVMGSEGAGDAMVSMDEIDRLIDDDMSQAETRRMDERIDSELARSGVTAGSP